MPMLQIKEIPDDVHRTLKARAALAGVSLTEYVRQTLVESARRKSREELVVELRAIPIRQGGESGAEAVRAVRNEYE
ncbi:MAG: FitA-like ribbon-helix-helix domain-containing protein [Thermoleophilaceae bacterium]